MIEAIWKFFMNIVTLGTYKANNAANDVLTKSPDGIRAAYDEAKNKLINKHQNIVNAVAKIQVQKSKAEKELTSLNDDEVKLQNIMEGIIQAIEKDPNNLEAIQDFNEMDLKQKTIDSRQEELSREIDAINKDLGEYKLALNSIANDISKIEKEANMAVADMELATMREQIETEKAGLQKSVDMSGVEAIRNKIAEKKAKVETLKMSNGSDVKERMSKYESQATSSASNSKLQEILEQRQAMKNAQKAGSASKTEESSETTSERTL